MTPSSEKPSAHDPLAALDNDLGDDWESAFQAEDFLFSPEEEPSDFFLFDENTPDKDEDIAALFADQDDKKEAQAGKAPRTASIETDAETSTVLAFPSRLQILAASLLQLFQSRPRHQRLLIGILPGLALAVIIASTLFFQAADDDQTMVSHAPPQQVQSTTTAPQRTPAPAPPPTTEPLAVAETIPQKWQLPTFVIIASDENKADLIIKIDLILTANLKEGQNLPDNKQTFVKDIIYQFYRNRPAYELKRFALARGEMISQLNAWLNKQWQNNPFDTITFSRYQVIQTTPPLAPKVTFM